jgi:hypothetical protein
VRRIASRTAEDDRMSRREFNYLSAGIFVGLWLSYFAQVIFG